MTYDDILAEAAQPVQPILSPGADYAPETRYFQGIPSIERAPGGRLWSVWYAGGQGESPLNYIILKSSGDDGHSWDEPALVIDPPGNVRACDPNVWLDPTGKLWVFWMQCHTLHDGRWGVWTITTDEPDAANPTWSAPRRICDGVLLNKPTVLANGDWLFPVSHLAAKVMNNERRMVPPFLRTYIAGMVNQEQVEAIQDRAGACVYVSSDQGKSFELRGKACAPRDVSTHNEHMVVEREDGSLLMLLRTSYGIGRSTSRDGGRTWSPVVESGIPHTSSRFFLRKLRSGRLLLVKHGPMETEDEQGEPISFSRSDLRAFLSEDGGESWYGGLSVEPGTCTYPDGTEGEDGRLYITYDFGRRSDKEIYVSIINEADIASGEGEREKLLVDKGTGVIPEDGNWRDMKPDHEDELIFTGI